MKVLWRLFSFLLLCCHQMAWGISCPVPNPATSAGKVIINEVAFHNGDWLELYVNQGPIDLAGWQLVLLGKGGINKTITLFSSGASNAKLPWDDSLSDGRFMVFASSSNSSAIAAGISNGSLVQNTNLFINGNISLHNTQQEMLLLDKAGNLVYYFGYANKQSQLNYDCVSKYPAYADLVLSKGNNKQNCTYTDGQSNGNQGGDWIAGCNGTTTVGQSNNPQALLDHYQIEHNSTGVVGTNETITVKACVNPSCTELLSEADSATIYLSNGSGSFSTNVLNFINGVASSNLLVNSAQTVQVALQNTQPTGSFSCLDELNGSSCNISFAAVPVGGQCSEAFPDGLSTHGSGSISFGYNAHLIGSPDNLLAVISNGISKNGGSSISTCSTADCSADPNGLLAAISPGTFQTTSSTDDVTVAYQGSTTLGSIGNEYRNVSSNSETTINFSAAYNEYKIDSLVLGYKGVLNLQANTVYWLNSFTMSSEAVINVVGSGTATIIVNASLQTSSPSLLNSPAVNTSGDASKLAIYSYGNISLNNQSTISAIVYAQGSLTMGSASYIFGAATANNISLNTNSILTYQANEVNSAELGGMCANVQTLDHYLMEFSGVGITCEPKEMTLKACANADCTILSSQQSIVDLTPTGWINESGVQTDSIVFTGSTIINLAHTSAGSVTVGQSGANPSASLQCDNAGSTSCNIAFSNAAMQFFGNSIAEPIGDQLAEQEFGLGDDYGDVNLRAVYNNNGVCEAALTGVQNVVLQLDCSSPALCLSPISYNGNELFEGGLVTAALEFNASGIATFSSANNSALVYPDVGVINLSASTVASGAVITTGATPVNVIPASLQVESANTVGYTAGKGFALSIAALGANNNPLPNYRPGRLQLKLTRELPSSAAASEGVLFYKSEKSITSSLTANFADIDSVDFTTTLGVYNYAGAYINEVGRFILDVQDADYLGYVISADETPLGRFIPAYFSVVPVKPDLSDACDAGEFTYVGQTFAFDLPAEFVVTAKNVQGDITNNYTGDLWKLLPEQLSVDSDFSYANSSSYPEGLSTQSNGTLDGITGTDVYDGTATIIVSNARFNYDRVNAEDEPHDAVAPFDSSLDLTVAADFFTDTDGVCFRQNADSACQAVILNGVNAITGTEQRFGRLALENTFGPETEPLHVTVTAEYFDGNKWQINSKDTCTAIDWDEEDDELLLTDIYDDKNILANIDPVTSAGFMSDGTNPEYADLLFEKSNSGPGVTGEIKLEIASTAFPAFLNFDWNVDGKINNNDKPWSTVSFGLYRGNDRVINWREVFN